MTRTDDGDRIDLARYDAFREDTVHYTERPAGVLRITLDDPARHNAMPQRFHDSLPDLYATVATDQGAWAVALEATGDFFSSGGRVDEGMGERTAGELVELHRVASRIITRLLEVPQVTICVVNGPAIGFAASLALHHDLVVATDHAWFADPHVRFGAVAGDGGTSIWPLALGPAKAREYLFTGARLSAVEAEQRGLINRVCPPEELTRTTDELLAEVRRASPLAVRLTKMAINTRLRAQAEWDMNLGLAAEMITLQSRDFRNSVETFRDTGRFGTEWTGE